MSCFQISQGKKLKVGPRHGGGDEVPGDFALLLEQVHAQQQGGRGALGHLHRVLRHHHHRRLHAGWSSSSILSISLICGFCFVLWCQYISLLSSQRWFGAIYILVNIPASSEERIAQRANKGFVLTFHVSVTPKMQRGGCRSCFLLRVSDALVNHLYLYFCNPASKIVTRGALQLFSAAGARVSHVLVNYLYLYLQVCLYL